MTEIEIVYPKSIAEWRRWLVKHHLSKQSVWFAFYSKKSQKPYLTWSEAVDVALCFGWIDSKKIKIDDERSHQFFSKRKPKSNWSKINKEKVDQLIEAGLMTEAGLKSIAIAKENGSWNNLDAVEELVIPDDLEKAFKKHKGSKDYFMSLSKSIKKMMLYWVTSAKRPETRQQRVTDTVQLAAKGIKANHYRPKQDG